MNQLLNLVNFLPVSKSSSSKDLNNKDPFAIVKAIRSVLFDLSDDVRWANHLHLK